MCGPLFSLGTCFLFEWLQQDLVPLELVFHKAVGINPSWWKIYVLGWNLKSLLQLSDCSGKIFAASIPHIHLPKATVKVYITGKSNDRNYVYIYFIIYFNWVIALARFLLHQYCIFICRELQSKYILEKEMIKVVIKMEKQLFHHGPDHC